MNKIKILKLMALCILVCVTPCCITSYTEKQFEIKDLKAELKAMAVTQEREAAKRITVKNEGINYRGILIPETNSKSLKILTVRLTVYWARGGSTDADSSKLRSSTGYTLKQGDSIAVDPRIIPYNKEVIIPNVGLVRAVDTGSAVRARTASSGKLPVVDVFFVNKKDAEYFANNNPKIVKIAVLN